MVCNHHHWIVLMKVPVLSRQAHHRDACMCDDAVFAHSEGWIHWRQLSGGGHAGCLSARSEDYFDGGDAGCCEHFVLLLVAVIGHVVAVN